MTSLRVTLFGKLCIHREQHKYISLDARRVQELFGYLLLYRDRPHSREALASRFWPETTTAKSKKYLRQALWQLQQALGAAAESENPQMLSVEPEWIQIDSTAALWLDVAEFEGASEAVRGVPGGEINDRCAQRLMDAVALYRGDLLEGCYEDWCLYERERLQNAYLDLLDKLIEYCEARGLYEDGVAYGTAALRVERARERTHRRVMRLHLLLGNRTAALRQYQHCAAALEDELGVEPAASTVSLYEQARSGQVEHPAWSLARAAHGRSDSLTDSQILGHFEDLKHALVELHRQIQDNLTVIDPSLDDRQSTDPA